MSRIGKEPVSLPSGVEVKIAEGSIHVKGPKGQLATKVPEPIVAEVADGELRVQRPDDSKTNRALHGLVRALTANMVKGVTEGFSKSLEIVGVGYRAEVKGKVLNLSLGFSHPVEMPIPEGLSVKMNGNTAIVVDGIDKQQVGQFAADIRSLRPPEPYKGKGVRYSDEQVRRKVGKTGA